jgi:cyclic pyranopterin phosphate synthase
MQVLKDSFNRVHDYLRISLTDKCNLNCLYCNPVRSKIKPLNRNEILNFDELLRLIRILVEGLGFKKIRFTGGEPLVRKDILKFFAELYPLKLEYGLEIGLTTNGTLLEDVLHDLQEYGIDRLNISLDSLKSERFKFITGRNNFDSVLRSISKAYQLGFYPLKINTVVIKNINDDELIDFVDFVKNTTINVRFIEFMPFGNNNWNENGFLGYETMKARIEQKFKLIEIASDKNKVAKDFKIEGFHGKVSFISPISHNFCNTCNRLRISAQGKMKLCLFSTGNNELNFKELFDTSMYSDEEIAAFIQEAIKGKAKVHPGLKELLQLEKNNMLSIGG